MTAKEFAEKHLGKECISPGKRKGIIIGYDSRYDSILVEIEDYGNITTLEKQSLVKSGYVILRDPLYATLCFNPYTVSLVCEKPKPKDFPHICNKCKSPALIMSLSIDCSNGLCSNKYKR
jgi:hypothetical protein